MSRSRWQAVSVIVAMACFVVAILHLNNQLQSIANGDSIAGFDHIEGRTLEEIPLAEFKRGSIETALGYMSRINSLVHNATYHCQPTDHQLSPIEWLVTQLFIRMGSNPHFELGIFSKSKMRCGFCSERAQRVTFILRSHNFDAVTYGIGGHVLTKVSAGGKIYFLDPDYGVGPYPANLPRGEIEAIYKHSALPDDTETIVNIIVNKADDQPYYSPQFFDNLRILRKQLYFYSDMTSYVLVSVAAMLCLGWLLAPRPFGNALNVIRRWSGNRQSLSAGQWQDKTVEHKYRDII